MAKKNEIVVTEQRNFLPVIQGIENTRELVVANMGTDSMNAFDLDRALNPSGKGTSFTIPGLDGEDESFKELEGIIVHHQSVRAYWAEEYKGGSQPPDCSSMDAIFGVGSPGGKCAECPFAEFGSGPNNAQACKLVKRIFLLREGELLPTLVTMSPVNYGAAKTYFLRLLSKKQLKFNHVITKISLESARSNSGFDYAKARLSMVEELPADMKAKMNQFSEMLIPFLTSVPVGDSVEQSEFEEPEF